MTLRELDWMADGQQRAEWVRFADLMALIANTNRSEGKAAYRSVEFNRMEKKPPKKRGSIKALRIFLPEDKQAELRASDHERKERSG